MEQNKVQDCCRYCTLAAIIVAVMLAFAGCGNRSTIDSPKTEQRHITIAAAADLQFAFAEIIGAFEKEHPDIKIKTVYGSSGNFFAQLSNKAPFDLFLSADVEYPRKLVDNGQAAPDSLFQYAIGQIVIWVRNDSPIDVAKLGSEALVHPSVKKIAIANSLHAPYGRAAEAAMKKLGLFDKVKDRLVLGENIAQTAQFVDSSAADIGIIAMSLALAPNLKDKGRWWKVPLDLYPTLEQAGVILNGAADRKAAQVLRDFMTGPEGRSVLERYGFLLPRS